MRAPTTMHRWSIVAAAAVAFACIDTHRAAALVETSSLAVVASVNVRCTIATVPVSFGNYMPHGVNALSPLDAVGGVSVSCTRGGNNVRLFVGQGAYPAPGSTNVNPLRRMGSGANRLSYNLYRDAARSVVWRAQAPGFNPGPTYPTMVNIYGRIPAAQNVPAGAYSDTVVAWVTF